MVYIDISTVIDKLDNLAESCIAKNDVINIATDNGNVILISEKRYNIMIDSIYLARDIRKVENTKTKEFDKTSPWD